MGMDENGGYPHIYIHSNSDFLNDNPLEFGGVPPDFQTHPYWDGWNTIWNTRFGGMNIHLPAILGVNKRGAGFWPLEEYHIVPSACQNGPVAKVKSDVRNDNVYIAKIPFYFLTSFRHVDGLGSPENMSVGLLYKIVSAIQLQNTIQT